MLAKGEGVPRDLVSAYEWLFLSQEKRQESANALAELRKTMSREQVEEAETRAKSWREAHKSQPGSDTSLTVPERRIQR
jgi:TPR repeat protein